MVSPQIRREQVLLACQRGLSQRHACGLIGIGRSALSYQARLPAKDAPVIAAMKMLSAQYPRYGYRRIRIFLRRQGFELGWSRTHRLWRQAGLSLPAKRPRRRIASNRPRTYTPIKANAVWAYDFVFDTTAQGQQIKCLTVIDEYTRECLAIDVAGSIRSRGWWKCCHAWSPFMGEIAVTEAQLIHSAHLEGPIGRFYRSLLI
jgi:putative transposase